MRRSPHNAAFLATWIFQLAWAAWFGGLIVLGAVSAPGIFQTARGWPEPASAGVVYRFAGIAAGAGFRRFNGLALACGIVLLLAGAAAWLWGAHWTRRDARLHAARAALVGICLAITAWLAFGMFPAME